MQRAELVGMATPELPTRLYTLPWAVPLRNIRRQQRVTGDRRTHTTRQRASPTNGVTITSLATTGTFEVTEGARMGSLLSLWSLGARAARRCQ